MPNPDNIKLLYNELKDSYDIESEDAFREYLSDANNREALRKELEADYDVGDSASFATYLGFGNEPSKPQAQTTVQPAEGQAPSDAVRAEYADTIMSDGEIVQGEKMETAQPDEAYNERMRGYQAGAEIGAKAASTTVANAKKNAPKEQPLQTAEPTQVQPQAQEGKGAKLTEEQRRAALQSSQNMLDQVNQGNQHIKNIGNYYQQRFAQPMGNTNMISLDKDKGVSSIANTRNVVEGREFNEESGKFEKTYTTQAGNKYREELPAVEEQAQIDAIFNKDIQSEEEAIDERIAENEAAQQAAMQRVRQEREAARSEHPVISAINEGLSGRNPYLSADIYENDNEIRSLRIERKQLEDAKRTLQAGKDLKQSENKGWTNFWGFGNVFTAEGRETIANNAANIFRGMEDAVSDLAFWDLGKSELDLGVKLKVISDKLEGGKELTDEELRIATAASLMNAVSGMVGENLPRGYKAGKTTAEMAPFMFQMAFSPLQGTGKALARQMVRKYGREGLGNIARRVAARVGGDLLQAGVLANTWQAGKTAGDILKRSAGEAQMGYDDGGKITLGGFDESKGLLQSAYEAEMVAGIENFTEMMGDMGIGSAVGKGVGYALGKAAGTKVGKALGIGKVTEFFEKASTSQIAKTLQRFEDKVHWNGNFGEIMEEQYGTALNSLFGTGEAEWGDFVDLDKQIDIILGVGLFGGAMSTIKTLGYPYEKHKNKVKLSKADDIAWMLLGGNRGKWGAIRDAIDKSEDRNLPVLLSTILEDEQYNNEQKRAILDYAFRLKAYQGSEKADMLARMEGALSAEQKESADAIEMENEANGVDRTDEVVAAQNIGAEEASNVNVGTEEPQEGQQTPAEVQVAYLTSLNELLALDNGEQIRSLIDETIAEGNDPTRMSETANIINGVSADERQIILDYIKARSERQGVIDKARNEANLIWLEYAAKFEPAQDENGTLTTGIWNGQVVVIKNWDNESDLVKILDAQGNEITVRRADLEGTIALNQPFEDWVNTNTADRVNALMNGVMAELGELATNGTNETQESVGGGLGMPQGVNGEGGAKPAEDGGPTDFPQGEIPPTGDNSPTPPTEPENIAPTEPTQPRTEGGMPLYEEGGKLKPDFKNATSEETYNYLYGERKMNRDDINAFVRNKVADAEKRLKKLEGKRPKMGTDLDEFEEKVSKWEKDKADTQKELDYWNDVQQRAKQENLDEQRENADLAAQWKKVAALDDAVSLHEYLMRQVYGGLKFIWDDADNKTKGLGSHLGLGNGAEKRSRRWLIGKKGDGAMYPEQAAEWLVDRYKADTGNDVEYDEVFNTLLDILRGYDRKSVLGNDILKEHNAAQFNEDTFNKEDEKRSKDAWAVEQGFTDFAEYEDYMKSLEGTERPQGEGNGEVPAELMGEPVVPTDLEKPQEPQAKEQPKEPETPAAQPQGTVENEPKEKVEEPTEPKREKEEPKGTFNPIEEAKKNVEGKEKKGTGKTSANGEKKEAKKEESKSKWVNDEDADEFEEIRRKLREKLNQLNSGFDPEALQLSIRMAYLLMKHGVRKFADFAKQVIDAIGDGVRPHLKSIYAAAYYDPRFKDFRSEMTPLSEMETFDVDNFDKKPKEEKALTDEWHYYVTWDKSTGRVTLYRESRDAVPVGDGRFHISAKNAEELRGILKNNGMEAILNEADVHNPLVASELHDYGKPSENNGEKGGENAGNDVSLQKSDKEKREAFTNAVASDLEEALLWGDDKPYKSIVDVRKRARELGMKVDEDGRTDILLQELVENGLVRAARKVVTDMRAKKLSRKEIYDTICQLYNLQPTITLRSSNRIKMQQYSTPLPMSFVAQMFIDAGEHTEGEIGLEPTAGNGMLVFATPAERLHVNELDETRLENLQGQGFKQVTNQDATKPFPGGRIYDFEIMNPPFGSREAKNYDGKKISGLDPQITLNALESMKDNGRAAIIIGGNMEYGDNGAIKGNKAFFTYLYDHYNVKGIVDMDGSLYRKQGTTYPTRMILIDGRRSEEERAQTTVYPPVQSKAIPVVKNEQELYDTVEGLINSKEKTNGTEVLQGQNWKSLFDADYSQGSVEQGGRTEQPGKNDSPKPQGQRTETEPKGNSGSSQPVSGGQSGPNHGNGKLESGNTGASGNGGSRGNTGNDNRGLGAVGTSNRGNGLSNQKKKEDKPNSDNRLSYRPHNTAFSLESVAPAAMVESMDKAVKEVEQKHGNIDEFVTKELGYDSIEDMHNALAAEQVDSVAMAIHQMMQGQALVIGDQTGVGKGRQMAALIRWAVKQGKKPIFFTQKADLFTDIYRDLVDIGSGDLRPFIFNSDGAIVDAKGKPVYKPMSASAQKEVFASGKVPDGYDFVALTYSQVNTGDAISVAEQIEAAKKNGARVSKKKLEKMRPTPKATFLRAIAEDNYLLLDESHTAAGSGNTGGYMQSIMRKAKGATFASATFAKRTDTMPIYAIRTAMSKANVEPEKLIAIIERGGVTLQEIMSRALTNAGQMVRRERDMGDVVTDWKTVDDEETVRRARENYDKTIAAFNAIIQFQNTFVKPKVDEIDSELSIMAGSSDIKQGTDQMGVSNVPFASKTYNYTKQLILALKVNAIVDEVDAQIKSGKHPVIALENTLESNLNDYAINEEIEEPTFSASLLRGLRTVMQYTIKDADGNEVHYTFSPSELGPAAEKAYEELENFIRESTRGIFISPLDAIIDKLHEKGYKVGELTGRNVYVEQTSDGKSIVRRRVDKDKKRMQREFNDGTLDVLILNKSASTGISLHASNKFTDQRQRCMVIAQPLGAVDDYMQMIGRTDRTGQVSRCYYVNLGLPVPAESRFLMMLSGKLKSLNANTTTSQDSESNDVQAPDLLNKYGSQVIVEYLRDNPEIYEKMGEPLRANNKRVKVSELDEYEPQEGDARKITGTVALLTTKEQEDFYIDVVGRYNSLIQYLNDIGANDLHITVMPLRAKTIEKKVSSEGVDPNGDNPFAQNAYLEKVEMDVLRKPMKSEEVHKLIEQVNNWQDGNAHREHIMEIVRSENDKKRETEEERYQRDLAKRDEDLEKQIAKINASTKRTEEEKREAIERLKNDTLATVEERHTRNTVRIDDAVTSMEQELSRMKVGDTFLIPDVLDSMIFSTSSPAIFCGYKAKESKITPSTTFAVFAVLDGRRKIEVKLSEYNVLRQIERVTDENYDAAHQTTLDNWDSSIPTGTRKEGYILTGNIIQAVSDSQNDRGGFTGQLISFTDEEGNVRDGILMPDNWNAGMLRNSGVPISARAADLKRGVDLKSTDGKVKVEKNYGYYSLSVPKTKKEGGKYFENEELLSLVSGNNFYPYRGQLRGDIAVEDIDDVLTILSNLGVRVEKAEDEGDARFREGNGKIEATPDLGYTKKQAERYREREQKRMRGHVAEMTEKMHIADKVVIHDTADGLKGRYATAKGWYDNKTGKIHVVIDNNRNIFDVMMTMMHEGVAHYGLRKMCGEHFDAFLDDVFANADESIKSAIRDKMDSMRNKDKNKKSEEAYRRAATEEYMADVAEEMEFSDAPPATFKSWWSKIKDLFLEMWGKLGLGKYFGPTITDNEIRYILWRSYQNLVNPGRYKNPFAVEEERAKAEERIEPKAEPKVEAPKVETNENVLVAADTTRGEGSNGTAKGFISTTQGDDYTFEQKSKMLEAYRMIKDNYNAIALLNTPTGYVLINDGAKAARKVFGLDNNPFVVIDKEGLDEFLPRMIRAGYRLAIADVMTDNKVSEDDVDVLFRDGEESSDIFVSNALRAVDGIKQEKATPEQWLKMIEKAGGLKAGEDKWMGLSEWLRGSDKKTLTKQEVQDFIRQNQIEIEEVHYGEGGNINALREKYPTFDDAFTISEDDYYSVDVDIYNYKDAADIYNEAHPENPVVLENGTNYDYLSDADEDRIKDWVREEILKTRPIETTRRGLVTDGLTNLKEIALVVPTIEPYRTFDEIHFGDAGEGRAIAWIRFGDTTVNDKNLRNHQEIEEEKEKVRNSIPDAKDWVKWDRDNGGYLHIIYTPDKQKPYGTYIVDKSKQAEERGIEKGIGLYVNNSFRDSYKTLEDAVEAYKNFRAEYDVKAFDETEHRVLVLDEVQSKRHQDGRELGYGTPKSVLKKRVDDAFEALTKYGDMLFDKYGLGIITKTTPEESAEQDRLRDAWNKAQEEYEKANRTSFVPDAPFDKNWHELAMKRMLRYAAENGYDKIAWTTGEQQAARYNIGNVVSSIDVTPYEAQSPSESNGHDLVMTLNDGTMHEMFVQPDGTLNADNGMFDGKKASEVFGKGIAEKIMSANEPTEISGEGLRIGAEGMAGFYDQMLPRFMDKYGKKWGVKTKKIELPDLEEAGQTMWAVDVTPEMKESVMQGQTMFRKGDGESSNAVTEEMRTTAVELATKLGVKVNIVDDVNSITHDNKKQQERRRNAKGWYNTSTGEVTIVLPNNRNVDDVVSTTLHEVVAHKGLREMVGEERYNEFLDEIYSHLKKDLKEKVDKMAFDMFMNGLGKSKDTTQEHRRVAVDEMLGKLTEKGFEDFTESEKSIWQKLKEAVLKILDKFLDTLKLPKWFTLGDNELRYILWRSKERMERGKESPLDMAKDNIKRRELGLDDREGDDLFRDSDHDVADDMGIAGGHYERMMRNSLFQAQEAMQDSMLSLKVLQEGIEKETGKPILDFENAYLAENTLSSTNKAELDLYNRMLMQPLIDEIASIAKKLYPGRKGRARRKEAINEISLYTIAKHGLERNEVFARRDADRAASNLYDDAIANAQKAVDADPLDQDAIDALDALKQQKQDYSDQEYEKNRERDYSGLTSLFETTDVADAEAKAQDAVDDFENAIGAEHTTDLWNCINNATQAILVKQKECGLLSNAQYQRASTMFQNYVPLRGFDDTVAEDVYEYFGGDFRVSGPVIRKAAGRTSLADNVFANIQSMADHGFMQANRNAMKQRFLMMAEGHKTDLVSVGQLWMAKNATTGEWELVYPELAADTLFKDAENAIENFDDLMAALAKSDPDNYKKVADNPNIPYKVLSDRNKAMHSVVVKRGGKSRIVTINGNPRAALALNGMTNPNGDNKGFIQKSLGKINWVNRHLSQLYTTWNPDFVASNFCRDIIYSHAMTLVREDAAYNARFTWNHLKNANPITMARLIRKYEKGTLNDADDLERNFLDFMKYGGETGYKSSREDLDEYKRSIESELKKANSGTRQFFSALLHLLENANRSVENSARFAAYLTSREVGRSTMRAIKDAKDITVNFNKKGAGDAFLDTKGQTKLGNAAAMMSGAGRGLYVFWNAGVQGLTNALSTIKNKETRGKAIAMLSSIFALGVGNVIYQILAGGDDDDESNGYFDLPSYTRRSAFCMKIPGTKTWMTPPLPPEFKAIYGLGELAASVLAGKEHYEGSELALEVGNQIGQMLPLNPWESGSGVWWAPSAVKPALEANMNIKWTGQPVQKETPYNTYAPEWTKAFSSADRNIVAATKWLNELGGGDEYKKADQEWLFDWSPAKIEYVLQGMMGGAYTFPSKLVKFGETVAGKRDFEWRNMPIANRFLTSGNDMTKKRAIDNEYFKYVDRLKSFQFRINGYNKDTKGSDEDKAKVSEKKLEELRKTEEFQKLAIFNDIKKRIDKLNKGYKATGSDELADSIMTLRKKANEVMRRSGEDLKHYIEVTFPREE